MTKSKVGLSCVTKAKSPFYIITGPAGNVSPDLQDGNGTFVGDIPRWQQGGEDSLLTQAQTADQPDAAPDLEPRANTFHEDVKVHFGECCSLFNGFQ